MRHSIHVIPSHPILSCPIDSFYSMTTHSFQSCNKSCACPALCHCSQVGIRLDEPSGLNNGTAKGVRIFECEEGFGSFVRGKNVTVGDFPERDLMDSDEEGEGEEGKAERDEDEI